MQNNSPDSSLIQLEIKPQSQQELIGKSSKDNISQYAASRFQNQKINFNQVDLRHEDEEAMKDPTVSDNVSRVSKFQSSQFQSSKKLKDYPDHQSPSMQGRKHIKSATYRIYQKLNAAQTGAQQEQVQDLVAGDSNYISLFSPGKPKGFSSSQDFVNIWRFRALPIIHWITKFVYKLKTKTDKIKLRLLTLKVFSIIGDVSADFEQINIKRKQCINPKQDAELPVITIIGGGLFNFRKAIFGNIQIIQPDSPCKMALDALVIVLFVFNIFYIPIKISFQPGENQVIYFFFEQLLSYVFIVNILINFNTAYYDKGTIHTNRGSILKHYLKKTFLLDIIILTPFFLGWFQIPFMEFGFFFRVARVRSMVKQLEDVLNMNETYQSIVDVIKLAYFVLYVAHVCGCAWHMLAYVEINYWNQHNNWLIAARLDQTDWYSKYIASIYWSTITVLTVGYGDITPVTDYERMFVIFVALIICGSLGYSISQIGVILQRYEEKKSVYKAKLRIINQYIKQRGLKKALQIKVRKYFEHYFMLENEENLEGEQFMGNLTKKLKEEVLIDIYSNILKNSRLIGENFPQKILNTLCLKIKEKKYTPEEEIFSKGEIANRLIFILKGEVQIYAEKHQEDDRIVSNIRTFKSGFVIGEREFSMNGHYDYSARALKFTQVAQLDYEDFIRIVREDTHQLEKFSLLKDNLIFNENFRGLGRVCEICQSTHSFFQCPFVFFQPNHAKIIADHRRSQKHNRFTFSRINKRFHTKVKLNDVQDSALEIILGEGFLREIELTEQYLTQLGFNIEDEDSGGILMQKSQSHRSSLMVGGSILKVGSQTKVQPVTSERHESKTYETMNPQTIYLESDHDKQLNSSNTNKVSKVSKYKNSSADQSLIDAVDDDVGIYNQDQNNIRRVLLSMPARPRFKKVSLNIAEQSLIKEKDEEIILNQKSKIKNSASSALNSVWIRKQSRNMSKQSELFQHLQVIDKKQDREADDKHERHEPTQKQISRNFSALGSSFLENNLTPKVQVNPQAQIVASSMGQSKSRSDETKNQSYHEDVGNAADYKLFKHTELNIDQPFMSNIYYPMFNIDGVIQKINNYQKSLQKIRISDKKFSRMQRSSQSPLQKLLQSKLYE